MLSLRSFLAATLVLGVSALPAACDGGGGLSLEEYFQKVDAIGDETDQQGDEADRLLDDFDPSAPAEEQIAAFQAYAEALVALVRDFHDRLAEIDPPEEVADSHDEWVGQVGEYLELVEEVGDRVADVESTEDVERLGNELFGSPEATDLFSRVDQTCQELQGIADDNGVEVDMECGE